MFKLNLIWILLFYYIFLCEGYKILVLFPLPRKSHGLLGDEVVKHLLDAGHEVTFITSYPNGRQHQSLKEIDVSSMQKLITDDMQNIGKVNQKTEIDLRGLQSLAKIYFKLHMAILEHENVVNFLKDPKEQFDVIIVEWMFNELISGISAVFNCPYIWFSTLEPHWLVLKLIDALPSPAYTSDILSSGVIPFSFTQRVEQLLKIVMGLSFQSLYMSYIEHREYKRLLVPIIKSRGHKVPDLEEVRYNASLMLGNSYVSMGDAIRLPQNYKCIGGYHVNNSSQHLSKDLGNILDNAKNGFIYFSMGSNLRGEHVPVEFKAVLLKIFGKLKQTVIWKYERALPNRTSNVHIVKWAPQQSVLAHPNCVLFMTHGGQLSITETIHFGRPIIGIPVFGDQFINVDRAASKGFAKRIDLLGTTAEELEKAIVDVLTDPRYTVAVQAMSLVYHDRPVPPGKELVHWVEHVVRTRGAPHLRSPALLLPWYQKCYLDLVALILAILYIVKLIVKKLIDSLVLKIRKKRKMH